jgi:hypothetical protein
MTTQSMARDNVTADDLWPKRYLTVHDLKGEARVVTIEDITRERMWDKQNRDWKVEGVIWFAEFPDKFFCVNRLNLEALLNIMKSRKLEEWIGKQVLLVPDVYRRKGPNQEEIQEIDVIRVKSIRKSAWKDRPVVTAEGYREVVNELGATEQLAREVWLACNKDYNQAARELRKRYDTA